MPITLPPLRDRKEDIPDLAQFFIRRFSKESKKSNQRDAPEEALDKLIAYDWPGNVRELANTIERVIVLGPGPTINVNDVSQGIVVSEPKASSKNLSYHQTVDGYRREIILQALTQTQGNRAAAARLLGSREKLSVKTD